MEYLIKMDNLGRLVLPKKLRGSLKTREFTASANKAGILLKPVPTWDEICGSSPNIDMKAFAKQHKEEGG